MEDVNQDKGEALLHTYINAGALSSRDLGFLPRSVPALGSGRSSWRMAGSTRGLAKPGRGLDL